MHLNSEGEVNLSASDVIWVGAQQVIEEIAQNPPSYDRNGNEGGCIVEQFNQMHPRTFDGRGDPTMTEE